MSNGTTAASYSDFSSRTHQYRLLPDVLILNLQASTEHVRRYYGCTMPNFFLENPTLLLASRRSYSASPGFYSIGGSVLPLHHIQIFLRESVIAAGYKMKPFSITRLRRHRFVDPTTASCSTLSSRTCRADRLKLGSISKVAISSDNVWSICACILHNFAIENT